MPETTVVIGVSLNPVRHSYRTVAALHDLGHHVIALGSVAGEICGVKVQTGLPEVRKVHTVTMYLKPERQQPYVDYILAMKPARLIFNKKTFNQELWDVARARGIHVMEACTLVMIAKGIYPGD